VLNAGTRRFDLYDFFSIFIPGAATLLLLLPFAPRNLMFPTGAVAGAIIIGGFVVGRGIHATALWLEGLADAQTHRDAFVTELRAPSNVSHDLASEFYTACTDAFDLDDLPAARSQLDDSHTDELEGLYTRVRSYVHIDARGRSRTFQAVLDFYRGIWIGTLAVAIVYMLYALVTSVGILPVSGVNYRSYLGVLSLPPTLIFYGVALVIGGAYGTFERVRSDYRTFYTQYLFSDFVVLQAEDTSTQPSGQSPQQGTP